MQKAANLPKTSGTYILLCPLKMLAYVGKCSNIRHRAAVWEYNFRKRAENPDHVMPVRDWPKDVPDDQWQFGGLPDLHVEIVRAALEKEGYNIMNQSTRVRDEIEYKGKKATLAEHAREADIPYTKVYYRFKAGKTLDEVFAK